MNQQVSETLKETCSCSTNMRTFKKLKLFWCLITIVTAGFYVGLSLTYRGGIRIVFHQSYSPWSSRQTHMGDDMTTLNMTLLDRTLNPSARLDVQTSTHWGAPILWEGTFDPMLFDQEHQRAGSSVAVTVFAVGKYLEVYLKNFLVSAEQHLMPGLPVTYFVFTDHPQHAPMLRLGPLRELRVIKVQKHPRWQDISMMRMKTISDTIANHLHGNFSHLFCFDVDQVFKGRWGSEALGESVAQIHSGYYKTKTFTYDRNPQSMAFLPQGDFYYHAAVFGGSLREVKRLVDFCHRGIMQDKVNQVEALWHDESHLNKFFYLHKPQRLLSPEYCWSPGNGNAGEDVHLRRLEWAPKDYESLRD